MTCRARLAFVQPPLKGEGRRRWRRGGGRVPHAAARQIWNTCPHPVCLRKPTSPLQGEVGADYWLDMPRRPET